MGLIALTPEQGADNTLYLATSVPCATGGHARDFVLAMHLILQQDEPDTTSSPPANPF
jgi:GDP-D-mannose dehydratase